MDFAAVEQAFLTKALAVPAVATTVDHEPQTLPRLPCVTLLWVGLSQDDVETGPRTENRWTWRINLYLQLQDYRRAQDQLKDIVPQLLAITRRDPSLGGTVDWARIADDGQDPVFGDQAGFLRKSLLLTVETTEE
jgi:hypothetical protein